MPSVFLLSAIMRGWDNILFASMLYVQLFCLYPFSECCHPDFYLNECLYTLCRQVECHNAVYYYTYCDYCVIILLVVMQSVGLRDIVSGQPFVSQPSVECNHYTNIIMWNGVILSIIVLGVIMLGFIMKSVIMPCIIILKCHNADVSSC